MKISYLLILLSNLFFAQSLTINAKQLNKSSILVRIKNTSSTESIKILLDDKNVEYSCDYIEKWASPNNFGRLAVCFDYPKNYNYQSDVVPRRERKKMYGNNQNLSIAEYIDHNTISIKANEEKEIIYNVSDFNNSLIFKKNKKFTVKCKIIYFGEQVKEYLNSSGLNDKYFDKNIYSNTFSLTINFFRP